MADIEMINDAFWLKYAKDHVTAAVTERDDAASKLDTYLGIIWPLYTAAFALNSTFNIIHSESQIPLLIILSLPILLIPIARFLCTWVQIPVLVEFHENIPNSIEQNLYAYIIKEKTRRLNLATGFTIGCGLMIGVALFTYKVTTVSETNNYFITVSVNKELKKLNIVGLFPKKTDVNITVVGLDSSNKQNYFDAPVLKSDDKGKINKSIDNNSIDKKVKAFASFNDDNKNAITITSE